MVWLKLIWRIVGCLLLVGGVVVLVSGAFNPFVGVLLLFPVVFDFGLRVFFPSKEQGLIAKGRCPFCGIDVRGVGRGAEYCPGCGEVLPASLRKYG